MALVIDAWNDTGDDVLRIDGHDDASGRKFTVFGWVSALTNFYPPSAYNADGTLKPGQTPRAMTAAERTAYLRTLIQARLNGERRAKDRKDLTDPDPEA